MILENDGNNVAETPVALEFHMYENSRNCSIFLAVISSAQTNARVL